MPSQSITGQSVLVTGGAGFIGGHLVEALATDNTVRVLDPLSTGRPSTIPADVKLIRGDVRDSEVIAGAMKDTDVVFHLAAIVSVPRSVDRPRYCHEVNVGATIDLLERARREDARVVFASSAAIYGQPARVPIEEGDPKRPASPYGLDKLTADHYVRMYADLYGLPTVALRYFNVYGPRQLAGEYSGVVTVFLERARRDEPLVIYGDGSQTRDFVHVTDVVQANLEAATTTHTGEAFNIGAGVPVTIRKLAEIVIDSTDSDSDIVHEDSRSGDIQRSHANITNARTKLGYQPTVSLSDGLANLAGGAATVI